MNQQKGKQSIVLQKPVYILASASVVGTKEGEGPLSELFDLIGRDDKFGCDSWEEAESTLQKEALQLALGKAGLQKQDLDVLLAGDLLGQSIASTFGLGTFDTPLIGLYGACSTCGLSLGVASMLLSGGFATYAGCVTSSHFASAEKEFRFPLGYGTQRPLSASWTVTGSGAFILSSAFQEKSRGKITGVTLGKLKDFGVKDSLNMGACMAPAAADTILAHFRDCHTSVQDYDRIVTGDLGRVGQKILIDMLQDQNIDIRDIHVDCGIEIYDQLGQDAHAGGSGCGCAAVTLSAYLLHQIELGSWSRILFVPTGAMLSKTSYNEGQSVPGIAHAIVIEKL